MKKRPPRWIRLIIGGVIASLFYGVVFFLYWIGTQFPSEFLMAITLGGAVILSFYAHTLKDRVIEERMET